MQTLETRQFDELADKIKESVVTSRHMDLLDGTELIEYTTYFSDGTVTYREFGPHEELKARSIHVFVNGEDVTTYYTGSCYAVCYGCKEYDYDNLMRFMGMYDTKDWVDILCNTQNSQTSCAE